MKFLEWHNNCVGNYNIFMIAHKNEAQKIVKHFDNIAALSCTFTPENGDEEYYYFLNTELKTITPMAFLALAFGGMYNGDLPYGEEIHNFNFALEDYTLATSYTR